MSLPQLDDADTLVTGGAGFIGSHLADRLLDEGANVTVLDNLSFGDASNVPAASTFVRGDVRDRSVLDDLVVNKDFIFHLAANATTRTTSMGWDDPATDLCTNALGMLAILESIRYCNPDVTLVYASSAAVYGTIEATPIPEDHPTRPISPYGVSKLAGEKYAYAYREEHGLSVVIARIFNSYGPRQSRYVMFDLIEKLRDDPTVLPIIGRGDQVRDYNFVLDTVDGLLYVAGSQQEMIFNVASGHPTTIMEVAKRVRDILAPEAPIVSEGEPWSGDIPVLVADVSRLQRTGYSSRVSLDTGIRELINYCQRST